MLKVYILHDVKLGSPSFACFCAVLGWYDYFNYLKLPIAPFMLEHSLCCNGCYDADSQDSISSSKFHILRPRVLFSIWLRWQWKNAFTTKCSSWDLVVMVKITKYMHNDSCILSISNGVVILCCPQLSQFLTVISWIIFCDNSVIYPSQYLESFLRNLAYLFKSPQAVLLKALAMCENFGYGQRRWYYAS